MREFVLLRSFWIKNENSICRDFVQELIFFIQLREDSKKKKIVFRDDFNNYKRWDEVLNDWMIGY